MARAVVAPAYGGPEVLTLVDVDPGPPPPDEVLVEHARRLVREMDAAERKEALENVDALKRQLDVLARELRREL